MDSMELQSLTKIVYYTKIAKMGNKKMVIIPKTYWDEIKDLEDEKQVKITVNMQEKNKNEMSNTTDNNEDVKNSK
jgi:antitoxin component of MazEF toxin-antitoxin module